MRKETGVWPIEIKCGSVTAKVYRVKNRDRYLFTLSYFNGSRRVLRQFATLEKAKAEARIAVEHLNAGRGDVLHLIGSERDSFLYAVRKLEPLGIMLTTVIDEYVACRKFGDFSLVEAARSYARSHLDELPHKSVAETFALMLEAKKQDGASDAYLIDLKKRLKRFCDSFQTSIDEVTTSDIDQWLRSLKLSPRSRNNFRNSIVTLFSFAKSSGFLPIDRETAAEHTAIAKDKGKAITFFTPEEFAKILAHSDEVVLPLLALGGFCGLRTVEVLRLRWEDLRWEDQNVIISEDISKGGQARRRRIAPLHSTAAAWLENWKAAKGPVIGITQPDERIRNICKAAEVPWRINGLRHSFIRLSSRPGAGLCQGRSRGGQFAFRNPVVLRCRRHSARGAKVVLDFAAAAQKRDLNLGGRMTSESRNPSGALAHWLDTDGSIQSAIVTRLEVRSVPELQVIRGLKSKNEFWIVRGTLKPGDPYILMKSRTASAAKKEFREYLSKVRPEQSPACDPLGSLPEEKRERYIFALLRLSRSLLPNFFQSSSEQDEGIRGDHLLVDLQKLFPDEYRYRPESLQRVVNLLMRAGRRKDPIMPSAHLTWTLSNWYHGLNLSQQSPEARYRAVKIAFPNLKISSLAYKKSLSDLYMTSRG